MSDAGTSTNTTIDFSTFGHELPAVALTGPLRVALRERRAAVVSAPPGSGKTTLVPPVVAHHISGLQGSDAKWDFSYDVGRTVVTQPRRIAARAAARRLAELTGTAVGELAGYTVRGERKTSRATRIEFVTPGILLRRLLSDPELADTAAVVCDEVHERQLDADLALGMLVELRQLRPDLALVAMSATVDATAFAELLGRADDAGPVPILDAPTTPHRLDVRYAPAPVPRLDVRGVSREFLHHVARLAVDSLGEPGDVLVFLPGAREIAVVADAVERMLDGQPIEVLQLHGTLDGAAQDRVLRKATGGRRRVIVSSSVAESSLTVPGVRVVVDSCLSREPRLDSARGVSGLVTVSCSQDAAAQRAGRAARLGDGVAIRAVAESDWPKFRRHRTPEITSADLTGALLDLACWGTPRGEGLPLLTAPPAISVAAAEPALRSLGLVDVDGAATPLGRVVARVPADPQHARALLAATRSSAETPSPRVDVRTAAEVIAALVDPPRRADASLPAALHALRSGRVPGARRWRAEAERLEKLAERFADDFAAAIAVTGEKARDVVIEQPEVSPHASTELIGRVVASAHPEWTARRTGVDSRAATFKLAAGSRVDVPGNSPLASEEWIAVAALDRVGDRLIVRLAAPLSDGSALESASSLLVEEEVARFDGSRLTARRIRRLGSIELSETPTRVGIDVAKNAIVRWAEKSLEADVVKGDDWFTALAGADSPAELLRRRLAFLRRELGETWPSMDAAALASALDAEFAGIVDGLASGSTPTSLDIAGALRSLVPWPQAGRLDEFAPERLVLPSGNSHRVRYPDVGSDDAPVVAAKLQEVFGLAESPRLADGRVPVTVELLSPAGRPLAVSRDLAFFWNEAYPGVRAEMRGRYPKHPWPENPWEAQATARTNRGLARG